MLLYDQSNGEKREREREREREKELESEEARQREPASEGRREPLCFRWTHDWELTAGWQQWSVMPFVSVCVQLQVTRLFQTTYCALAWYNLLALYGPKQSPQ